MGENSKNHTNPKMYKSEKSIYPGLPESGKNSILPKPENREIDEIDESSGDFWDEKSSGEMVDINGGRWKFFDKWFFGNSTVQKVGDAFIRKTRSRDV